MEKRRVRQISDKINKKPDGQRNKYIFTFQIRYDLYKQPKSLQTSTASTEALLNFTNQSSLFSHYLGAKKKKSKKQQMYYSLLFLFSFLCALMFIHLQDTHQRKTLFDPHSNTLVVN